jgi:hypothetical protein
MAPGSVSTYCVLEGNVHCCQLAEFRPQILRIKIFKVVNFMALEAVRNVAILGQKRDVQYENYFSMRLHLKRQILF